MLGALYSVIGAVAGELPLCFTVFVHSSDII